MLAVTIPLNYASSNTQAVQAVTNSNILIPILGVVLIIGFFLVVNMFKRIVANTALGVLTFFIAKFLLGATLPITVPTILVTVLFGLGGVGTLLILSFFGML